MACKRRARLYAWKKDASARTRGEAGGRTDRCKTKKWLEFTSLCFYEKKTLLSCMQRAFFVFFVFDYSLIIFTELNLMC
jgi:hypothetical protein